MFDFSMFPLLKYILTYLHLHTCYMCNVYVLSLMFKALCSNFMEFQYFQVEKTF